MNRRKYMKSIFGVSIFTITSGCISTINPLEYNFELISLYDDIQSIELPEEMDELPHLQINNNDIIIEGYILYGDCEQPIISNMVYNKNKQRINITVSTESTKSIFDKIINSGCTLGSNVSGYRITIPMKDIDIQSIHIIEHRGENTDEIIEL